jgi:hypothetical protein
MATMVLVIAGATILWFWFGLTQRSLEGPDSTSMTAIKGILEYGIQRFPSGYIYHRGYAAHYPVAVVAYIFGLSKLSIVLPGLLMSLGTLWITYLFARDILGRPWLGVLASAILINLSVQTFYATSPRMYGALEFFSMLANYSSWRGFIRDEVRFRILAFIAVSLAILSNQQGIVLIAAIPAALLVASYLKGKNWRSWLISGPNIAGILLVIATAYFQFGYQHPASMPNIAYDEGRRDERIGPTLDVAMWAEHAFNLELALPYGLALFLVTLLLVYNLARTRQYAVLAGILFALIVFVVASMMSGLGQREVNGTRFWLFVLPIYSLLICLGAATLVEAIDNWRGRLPNVGFIDLRVAVIPIILGIAISLGAGIWARGVNFTAIVADGYGLPCQHSDCSPIIESVYNDLSLLLEPEDLIISSRPTVTYHYLGRVDVVLREKTPQVYQYVTEEKFGVPVIENPSELQRLLSSHQRVWVIGHSNMNSVGTPELFAYVESDFAKIHDDRLITVYLGCSQPPCLQGSQ